MAAPSFTLALNGQPVPSGAAPVLPGAATLTVRPGAGGWPVLPGAPRVPFLTLLLEGAGLAVGGATVGGQALQTFAVPLDAGGQALHPLARGPNGSSLPVQGPPGGTLVAVRLPYGMTLPGAHPDVFIALQVSPGAAPLRVTVAAPDGSGLMGAQSALALAPAALTLAAAVDAPEGETVAGALQELTVRAEAAAGVSGLVLQASLPPGAVFDSVAMEGGTGTASFDAGTGLVSGQFTQLGTDPRMAVRFRALGPGLLGGTSRGAATPPGGAAVLPEGGTDWAVAAKPLTLRSSVAPVGAPAPGQPLEWTLTGAVSPAGATGLSITDTLGNGQRLDAGFTPWLTVFRGGTVQFSGAITPAVTQAPDGTSTLRFDVSNAATGVWSLAGSTFDVVFRSTVSQLFGGAQAGQLVGQGDRLGNAATLDGTVRGASASDATAASLTLPGSTLHFSIYAVNGQLVSGPVRAAIGDAVTYRVQAALPLTTARGFAVVASGPGPLGGMVFDGAGMGIPAAGHARFGPSGSYTANAPAVQATADGAVRFGFGYVQPVYGNGPATLDLLYTARLDSTATDPGAPEAQAWLQESNVCGEVHSGFAAAGLVVEPPLLRLQTASLYASNNDATWTGTGGPYGYSPFTGQFGGTVSSAGLAAEPFSDALRNVDAGDEVTFVIAAESLTAGPAYGVVLHNAVPAGFVIPPGGADVAVTDGDGNLLAFSGNLFDPATGLTLTDPLPGYDRDSGHNIALVTFTLRTAAAMAVPAQAESVARLLAYRTEPGGANLAPAQASGTTASTGIATSQPTVSVALASTGGTRTAGSVLAPGETAAFNVTVTLPEGQVGALTLGTLLPAGLEFVSAAVLRTGGNLYFPGGIVRDGQGFRFGAVTNAADDRVTDADRILVQLVARAGSVPVASGRVSATLGATGGGGAWSGSDYADVSVAAPRLALQATAPALLQAGQAGLFTIRLSNAPGAEPAFNIRLANVLSPGLAVVAGSLSATGTAAAAAVTEAGGTVTATLARLGAGETLVLTVQARALPGAAPGAILGSAASAVADALGGGTALVANALRADAAAATRVTAPAVSMALLGAQAVPVGGAVAFRITATVPEGSSPALTLQALLPAGLLYVAGSARVAGVGGGLPGLPAPAVLADAQGVRLQFGAVEGTAGDRSLVVELRATVSAAAPVGPLTGSAVLQTGYAAASASVSATVANTPPALTAPPPLLTGPDNAAIPLPGVSVTDPDAAQTLAVRITLSDPANGTLAGAAQDPDGTYRIAGPAPAVNAALAAMRFVPVPHRAPFGTEVRTGITLTVQDGAGGQATANTTVAATAANTPPTLSPLPALLTTPDTAAVALFPGAVLTDPDAGQAMAVRITLSNPGNGTLAGATPSPDGTYRIAGPAAAVNAALAALRFVPVPHRAAFGTEVRTTLTLTVQDGAGGQAAASTTIAALTSNTPPTLTPLPPLLTALDTAASPLFPGVVLTDPDAGQVQTLRITLSNPGNGTLTGAIADPDGSYRITGTTAAANAALAGIRFVPVPHRAASGAEVRTGITLTVQDGAGGQATAAMTVATGNTAPMLGGLQALPPITTGMAALPFAALLLSDVDAGQLSTLTVQMDPARGQLVSTAGRFDGARGTFRMTGLLPALQAAARGLAYVPDASAAGTASFALTLDDGAGGRAYGAASVAVTLPAASTGPCGPTAPADFLAFAVP